MNKFDAEFIAEQRAICKLGEGDDTSECNDLLMGAAYTYYPAALDEIERLNAENANLRDENQHVRDTLADNEAYCAPLVMENNALTRQSSELRDAIYNLIYSVTENGYKAAREKAEKLIAPMLLEDNAGK